jgi:predicted DNA-binding ribbon-helix-helix protein
MSAEPIIVPMSPANGAATVAPGRISKKGMPNTLRFEIGFTKCIKKIAVKSTSTVRLMAKLKNQRFRPFDGGLPWYLNKKIHTL